MVNVIESDVEDFDELSSQVLCFDQVLELLSEVRQIFVGPFEVVLDGQVPQGLTKFVQEVKQQQGGGYLHDRQQAGHVASNLSHDIGETNQLDSELLGGVVEVKTDGEV